MPSNPPREMSEAERRRRAAARARRKKEIRRNRIIFAIICLVLLALIIFGMVKLVGMFTKDPSDTSGSGSTSISSSQQVNTSSSSEESSSVSAVSDTSQPASGSASQTGVAATTSGGDAEWLLTLVNNNVKLPDGWEDGLEVKTADVQTGKELASVAADAYINMKSAAAKDGIELMLCSGYRTVEYQTNLFDAQKKRWLDKGLSDQEAYDKAKTAVAVPGYSEHNSGLAADIVTPEHQNLDDAYGKTDAAKWLAQHAPEYGFILRYPENKQAITGIIYEPWHFRYVGVENAKAITESGLCLEEYVDQNLAKK